MEKVKTVDISGMGGSYELCCQVMLFDALEYFKDQSHEEFERKWAEEERVTKEYVAHWSERNFTPFEDYRRNYPHGELHSLIYDMLWGKYDPTGAMAGAVLSHFFYIRRHGHDGWIRCMEGKRPKDIYEIDADGARRELEEHLSWSEAHPEEAAKQAFEAGKRAGEQP